MSDENLLTLKQLATELGLPESTVRYYRDQYIDQIPSVGTGRRRRYPREAVAILRSIAESYAAGGSRADITNGVPKAAAVPVIGQQTEPAQHTMEHVTNLDLLAAILDGEREQRDALWQMAKEIVRLTEVLQEQDQVLLQIADKAGVEVKGSIAAPRAQAALGPGAVEGPGAKGQGPESPAAAPTPVHAPPPPPVATPAAAPQASSGLRPQASESLEKLKRELEEERQLVERLREAKLQLERRTADAEAALEDRGANPLRKSGSMLRRLLGGNEE